MPRPRCQSRLPQPSRPRPLTRPLTPRPRPPRSEAGVVKMFTMGDAGHEEVFTGGDFYGGAQPNDIGSVENLTTL